MNLIRYCAKQHSIEPEDEVYSPSRIKVISDKVIGCANIFESKWDVTNTAFANSYYSFLYSNDGNRVIHLSLKKYMVTY